MVVSTLANVKQFGTLGLDGSGQHGETMPEPITLVGFGSGLMGVLFHLARRYFETAKEILDIVLGAILLIVALPILVLCGLIIRLTSKGPVLYTQLRVGKGGKPFRIYKLRTMYPHAEASSGAIWAGKNDSRIVPACRWMRRSHVDELPQLINVLKGDMSLVGPRPERPEILNALKQFCPDVDKRLTVRPGITGLAQIRNGYDTDLRHFNRKLQFDLEYIRKRHWSLELSILFRTLRKFRDPLAR